MPLTVATRIWWTPYAMVSTIERGSTVTTISIAGVRV
jgi:hypothetical protein